MSYKTRLPKITAELAIKLDAVALAAAQRIEQAAKENVPVDTGKLRDAIHIERDSDGYMVIAGDNDTFYGHIVEHGGAHTSPRPFLVPALENNRNEIIRMASLALRNL